jgi:hypothetical protein
MTIKTKKTKKSNNSNTKTKVPKNLEQKINELKKIQVELDDCMYSNCKSMSKKEITDMLEQCKKKTEHIKSIIEKSTKKLSCMVESYMKKGDKFKKMFECVNDKCSDKTKKSMLKAKKLSTIINPDMNKIKGIQRKIQKLHSQYDKCYDKKCKPIFPDSFEIWMNCNKKNKNLNEKEKKIKMQECLKPFNYDEKMKKVNECDEKECKPISNKLQPEINTMQNEILKITEKTIELSAKYAKIYDIPERTF